MRRSALAAFVVAILAMLPGICKAQSEVTVRNGSALYPGIEVNLADGDGLRRLQLAFEAQCADERGAQLAASPQAREAVLLLLRGKSVAELSTPRGKNKLKTELAEAMNRAIGGPRVVRILLLQFVIL